MSTPDLPRPYPEPGRDDRSWNGQGNGRRARPAGDYGSSGDYGRRGGAGGYGNGYGRARGGGRGGEDTGIRSWGSRLSGGRDRGRRDAGDGWQGGSGRAGRDSGRGAGRDSWRPGGDRRGPAGDRDGRMALRSEAGPRDRGSWGRRADGGAADERWGGGGTAVRERLAARVGSQYRGDGRLRGLSERMPGGGRGGRGGGPRGSGPGGGGPRMRRKGDWWRYWTWKKAATVAGIGAGVCTVIGAIGVGVVYAQTTIPNPQADVFQQSSTVYYADGKTAVGQFGSTNRQMLTYNQIPQVMKDAMVAAEDKHFYHEGGISPTGIVRALYYDLSRSGGAPQGASTLTQELVRQYYDNIGTQQTISRKIKEIFVAEKLARQKSKAWILTTYLNTVDFGSGAYGDAYGVGAAAQFYFGEPASKLTAGQAALIAAMPQSPSYYYLGVEGPHPDKAARGGLIFRWNYVLKTMLTMGTLSQQQYDQTLKQGFPKVVPPVNNDWGGYRGYIMQAVQNELRYTYHFKQNTIDNGGLHIVTTFRPSLMRALYAAVRSNENLMRHNAPPSGIQSGVTPDGLPKYVRVGAVLENPSNGAIEAMYSGPDYSKQQYDNALQARNQVGSSFKPYVLAAAVKQGMNVMTSKLNGYSPLWIPPDSDPTAYASSGKPTATDASSWYQVSNDEVANPNRPVSVTEATAMSLNTSYTDLWHRVAYNAQANDHPVVDIAKAFGVDTSSYQNGGSNLAAIADEAGTALGQASLTVEEQATMIATLANGGTYHTPHVIKQVSWMDPATGAQTSKNASMIMQTRQVLTPQEAADVDYAMSFDTSPMGTAAGLGLTNGQTIIAKTGTTNLAQSAFFEGATPMDAMAVGMFVNNPSCPPAERQACASHSSLSYAPPPGIQTLFGVGGLAGYGGGWPTQIWHTFFMNEFDTLPAQQWPAVNTAGMATWNLVGPNMMPKPKPKHQPQPQPQPGCFGNGRHCKPGGGGLPPTPAPTPTTPCGALVCPSATPSPQPTAGTKG